MKEKKILINKELEIGEIEALKDYYLNAMQDSILEFNTGLSHRKVEDFESLKGQLEFLIDKYKTFDVLNNI